MDVNQLPCNGCKYPGFNKLVFSCRHPAHPGPINGKRLLRILSQGGKCGNRIDAEKKVMLGAPIPWSLPVNFEERS